MQDQTTSFCGMNELLNVCKKLRLQCDPIFHQERILQVAK